MSTCIACGAEGATETVLPSYDDDTIGIPVTIRNAVLRHSCETCGFRGLEIPDPEGYEAAVAVARVLLPAALSGKDIKALRKACGMTGKQFAAALGVSNAALSRWENGDGASHGVLTDKTIRDVVAGLLHERVPAIALKPGQFLRMEVVEGPAPRLVMERVRLKDSATQAKSDQWDVFELAA